MFGLSENGVKPAKDGGTRISAYRAVVAVDRLGFGHITGYERLKTRIES